MAHRTGRSGKQLDRLNEAAARDRVDYLRTHVDPVFLPMLDAVVFHKPESVPRAPTLRDATMLRACALAHTVHLLQDMPRRNQSPISSCVR